MSPRAPPARPRTNPPARATCRQRPRATGSSAAEALAIADRDPEVAEQTARYGRLETAIEVEDDGAWQVGYKSGGRRGRPGRRRRGDGRGARVLDRLPGRLADGARLRGPVRPRPQRPLRLDPALRDLPRRAARLAPAVADRPPRSARAARVRRLARLLQPGRDRGLGAARLPGARLPARAHALARLPRRGRPAPDPAGDLARGRRRRR